MLVFFYTDAIKINRKSIAWNRKPSCVLREKDRQLIKTTSNLVFKLIIALIWKIRSPSQFSKCRNSHVKTKNIATIDAITMLSGLRTSSEGEITKSPRNFHVPKVPTTTRFYATCIHELKVYVFCRFYLVGKPGPKKCGSKPQLLIQCTREIIWNFFLKDFGLQRGGERQLEIGGISLVWLNFHNKALGKKRELSMQNIDLKPNRMLIVNELLAHQNTRYANVHF